MVGMGGSGCLQLGNISVSQSMTQLAMLSSARFQTNLKVQVCLKRGNFYFNSDSRKEIVVK